MKILCPRCKEVILGFGHEETIECSKCETTFTAKDELDIDREG